MFIKRLKHNFYDVFMGVGWNNWTRVQRHRGDIHVVSGNRLDKRSLDNLKARLK